MRCDGVPVFFGPTIINHERHTLSTYVSEAETKASGMK